MARYVDIECDAVTEVLPRRAFKTRQDIQDFLDNIPTADVAPVVRGRCPICSGRKDLTQDRYNEHFVEVDAELGEMSIWRGYLCLAVIPIKYCPNCGARMHGGENNG